VNSHAARRSRRDRSEQGASLILALVFIVVVAVIVGAISSLTLNDLNNTASFNSATNTDYSASNVANLAIQSVRYVPQATNGVLGACWTTGGSVSEQSFNNETVAIWCDSVPHPGSSQSRVVTMYAGTLPTCSTAAGCKASPLLTLVEAYDDYSAAGTDTCPTNPGIATCGAGASTLVWTWGPLAAVGGQILNTITNPSSPPSSPKVGGQYTPTATTTSGDPIVVTTQTPTDCTVSDGVVTFVAAGPCTLNFNDQGTFIYAQAPQFTQTFQITT
jgi:Tfp pilus assembly protein PilV